jgi:hypothetical protein
MRTATTLSVVLFCSMFLRSAPCPADDTAPATTQPTLSQPVGQVHAAGLALSDLLDQLSRATNQKIQADWPALQRVHVTKDLPITIDLSNLPLDSALTKLLNAVGGNHARLTFTLKDQTILITLPDQLGAGVVSHVYNIRPITQTQVDPAEATNKIVRALRGIDPLSWKTAGGQGQIDILDGYLIVTQTPQLQTQVDAELTTLETAQLAAR